TPSPPAAPSHARGNPRKPRPFLAWLPPPTRLDRPRLPVLLTLHGRHPTAERELDGWPGYAHSRPVRIGNGAANQHQLDGPRWGLGAPRLPAGPAPPLAPPPRRQAARRRDLASHARLRRRGRETVARTRRRDLGD